MAKPYPVLLAAALFISLGCQDVPILEPDGMAHADAAVAVDVEPAEDGEAGVTASSTLCDAFRQELIGLGERLVDEPADPELADPELAESRLVLGEILALTCD